jgi:hypothetical protein
MADKDEKKPAQFSECPKCRKHGYYASKDFYACRYCGYTAPDPKAGKFNQPVDKLNHGTKPGGMHY